MKIVVNIIALTLALGGASASGEPADPPPTQTTGDPQWQQDFNLSARTLVTTGRNPYFVLETGFQLTLANQEEKLLITVLDQTEEVMGHTTRVVEEREWESGTLVEISRNFYALDQETGDIFYFGEDVDNYEDGVVANHGGTWRAGVAGAKPGLFLPGAPEPGLKFYLEFAPGLAMDHAEVVSLQVTMETPAGIFENCLKTQEGSDLDPSDLEFKIYAPAVGLLQDEDLVLVSYGFAPDR